MRLVPHDVGKRSQDVSVHTSISEPPLHHLQYERVELNGTPSILIFTCSFCPRSLGPTDDINLFFVAREGTVHLNLWFPI